MYTIGYTAAYGIRWGIWYGRKLIKGHFATLKEAEEYLKKLQQQS